MLQALIVVHFKTTNLVTLSSLLLFFLGFALDVNISSEAKRFPVELEFSGLSSTQLSEYLSSSIPL